MYFYRLYLWITVSSNLENIKEAEAYQSSHQFVAAGWIIEVLHRAGHLIEEPLETVHAFQVFTWHLTVRNTQTHKVRSVQLGLDRFLWCVTDVRCWNWLQVFPGNVRVSAGPGTWRCPAQCQDVGSESCNPFRAKLSVDEVQMCADDNYCRVWGTCLPYRIIKFKSETKISPKCKRNSQMIPGYKIKESQISSFWFPLFMQA